MQGSRKVAARLTPIPRHEQVPTQSRPNLPQGRVTARMGRFWFAIFDGNPLMPGLRRAGFLPETTLICQLFLGV
jgi:hypothetical protein